jgi:hypothetical protein
MTTTFAQDLAQMMADWNAATPEQREQALAAAATLAAAAEAKMLADSAAASLPESDSEVIA